MKERNTRFRSWDFLIKCCSWPPFQKGAVLPLMWVRFSEQECVHVVFVYLVKELELHEVHRGWFNYPDNPIVSAQLIFYHRSLHHVSGEPNRMARSSGSSSPSPSISHYPWKVWKTIVSMPPSLRLSHLFYLSMWAWNVCIQLFCFASHLLLYCSEPLSSCSPDLSSLQSVISGARAGSPAETQNSLNSTSLLFAGTLSLPHLNLPSNPNFNSLRKCLWEE